MDIGIQTDGGNVVINIKKKRERRSHTPNDKIMIKKNPEENRKINTTKRYNPAYASTAKASG